MTKLNLTVTAMKIGTHCALAVTSLWTVIAVSHLFLDEVFSVVTDL